MDTRDTSPASCAQSDAFLLDLTSGLNARPRSIPPKYFYDAAGSALFDHICALPEYYPTRTEVGILECHATEMAGLMGNDIDLLEFGAGSLRKVRLLLQGFRQHNCACRYVPIDISGEHLTSAARQLSADFPALRVRPVVCDYTTLAKLPDAERPTQRRIGFFPGSTIGNMHPTEAQAFLSRAASLLSGGGLLIGVDLVKSPALLHAAYNDAQGVTAAFNLNLLARANRELDADFDLAGFAHHALYQPVLQRIEMHLVSKRRQRVTIGDAQYMFEEGESIHTENSYKFTMDGFRQLATRAGFVPEATWLDARRSFSVHWLAAP